MAEEGKRKQSPGRPPEYIKLTESLSTVDNDNQTLIYPEKPTEPVSSEPKVKSPKPEPKKPEKINVREASAKTKTDPLMVNL